MPAFEALVLVILLLLLGKQMTPFPSSNLFWVRLVVSGFLLVVGDAQIALDEDMSSMLTNCVFGLCLVIIDKQNDVQYWA